MDCTDGQHGPERALASPAAVSALEEATGDSESEDLAAGGSTSTLDADDGDAESCSGGESGSEMQLDVVVVPWGWWPGATGSDDDVHGVCPAAADADVESDKLFWESCIAHGY